MVENGEWILDIIPNNEKPYTNRGNPFVKGNYVNGKKQGKWYFYLNQPQVEDGIRLEVIEGLFEDDMPVGIWNWDFDIYHETDYFKRTKLDAIHSYAWIMHHFNKNINISCLLDISNVEIYSLQVIYKYSEFVDYILDSGHIYERE